MCTYASLQLLRCKKLLLQKFLVTDRWVADFPFYRYWQSSRNPYLIFPILEIRKSAFRGGPVCIPPTDEILRIDDFIQEHRISHKEVWTRFCQMGPIIAGPLSRTNKTLFLEKQYKKSDRRWWVPVFSKKMETRPGVKYLALGLKWASSLIFLSRNSRSRKKKRGTSLDALFLTHLLRAPTEPKTLRYVHAFLAILTPHLQTSITYRCH